MVTGAITTVVSLFYYIKVPLNLFLKRSATTVGTVSGPYGIVVLSVIISIVIVLLGIFPGLVY
jgi:NADH-quinone oxidoreductase subunit N